MWKTTWGVHSHIILERKYNFPTPDYIVRSEAKLKTWPNATKWPLPPSPAIPYSPSAVAGIGGGVGGRGWGGGGGGCAFSPLIRGAERGDRLSDRQAARTQLWRLVSSQWQPYDELPLLDDSAVTQWYRRQDCSVAGFRSPPVANEDVNEREWNETCPCLSVLLFFIKAASLHWLSFGTRMNKVGLR